MKKNELELQSKRTCFDLKDSGINFVLSLVIPFLASLALIVLFMFLAAFSGYNYNDFLETEFVKIVNMLFTPTVFFLIYFIYCRKTKVAVFKASEINFKVEWLKVLTIIVMSVASVFLISPMISLLNYGFSLINYNPSNELPYIMDNAWRLIAGIITMAILPAICEELLFRGLIFKGLQEKFNPHIAILISAAMFTLLHGSLQQTVYQFILGMMLGYAIHYGKSIIYPILLHFVNNIVVVISSFCYTMQGIDVNVAPVYNSAWDYILPVLCFVLAAVIIVGLIFVLKYLDSRNKKEIESNEVVEIQLPEDNSKKEPEKQKNVETTESEDNIIVEEPQVENSNKLTKADKVFVFGSMGLGLFLWLTNTIMQFFGL